MSRTFILCLLLSALPLAAAAADKLRYVSDNIFIVLHKGPGTEYRWKAKLTPGTKLTINSVAENGEWAEVTTSRGTSGWVRNEYLTASLPAQVQLPAALARIEKLSEQARNLGVEMQAMKSERSNLKSQMNSSSSTLKGVSAELSSLKKISGQAVQLDVDNRRLIEESENLRSEVEMLEAENQRLEDKLDSDDFLNGALAVFLGVIIALVVPRLWPRRRKSSSWA